MINFQIKIKLKYVLIEKNLKKWFIFIFDFLDVLIVLLVVIDVDCKFWNVFNFIKVIMVNVKICICSFFFIIRVLNERMNFLNDKIFL